MSSGILSSRSGILASMTESISLLTCSVYITEGRTTTPPSQYCYCHEPAFRRTVLPSHGQVVINIRYTTMTSVGLLSS